MVLCHLNLSGNHNLALLFFQLHPSRSPTVVTPRAAFPPAWCLSSRTEDSPHPSCKAANLPCHFPTSLPPLPAVSFQTLLCSLSNQGFIVETYLNPPKSSEIFVSFFCLLQWVFCLNCEHGKHKKKKLKRNM